MLTFNTKDFQTLFSKLQDRGVEFFHLSEKQPWGTFATLIDSEGNQVIPVEPPKT